MFFGVSAATIVISLWLITIKHKIISNVIEFITMENGEFYNKKTKQNQPMLEYTVHILKPIYPKQELSKAENIEYMKKANYDAWVKVYEDFYGEKLTYLTK